MNDNSTQDTHRSKPVSDRVDCGRDGPDDAEKGVLRALFTDVLRLAIHAVETGQLPASVDMSQLYEMRGALDAGKRLEHKDIDNLSRYYQTLERALGEVTAETLWATEVHKINGEYLSEAGKYVRLVWKRTLGIVGIILLFNLIEFLSQDSSGMVDAPFLAGWLTVVAQQVALYLLPFMYGALGASVYILRVTEDRLRKRQFDPRRIPQHRSRFMLGTLSGGVIILFVHEIPAEGSGVIAISVAALGFLAGYSIDFLFDTMDRIILAILPKVGLDTVQRRQERPRVDQMVRRYQALADESEDQAVTQVLGKVLEDLRRL